MGEPDEHEQLRERPALAVQALVEPLPGERQELREEPGLIVSRVVAEVFLESLLGESKSDFAGPAVLQVIERVDADFAD